jgi:hypothetical protein
MYYIHIYMLCSIIFVCFLRVCACVHMCMCMCVDTTGSGGQHVCEDEVIQRQAGHRYAHSDASLESIRRVSLMVEGGYELCVRVGMLCAV